ncbi:hypothetical protein L6452_16979 [Arctium lappa]|uniref:Uncharacterized protein n=1 Tax=Arctium lappa TaxID=4217 RepID=A0ACB9C2A5_ARCLA|nr:hypothetical protein L6452_16979 [Arctium lappa]
MYSDDSMIRQEMQLLIYLELQATPINIATNKHQNHRDKFEGTSHFKKMVLTAQQRFPGAAAYVFCPGAAQQQQSILIYQSYHQNLQDGSYSNAWGRKTQTTPYPNHPQVPISPAQHHQSAAWSTLANCDDNGDRHHPGGGVVTTGLPNTETYGSSCHGNSSSHGNLYIHEHNRYGNGLEYHHIPSRMNYGYKKPFGRVKSLDDE